MFEKAFNSGFGYAFGLSLMVLFIIFFLMYKARKKHQLFLHALADELGFEYTKTVPTERRDLFKKFDLIQTFFDNTLMENCLWGKIDGFDVEVFDVKSISDEMTVYTTVGSFCDLDETLPDFYFGRKALIGLTRQKTITLSQRANDLSHYTIEGENELSIKRLFDDKVIDFLQKNSSLEVDVKDNKMLCYTYRRRLKPKEYRAFIQKCKKLYELLIHANANRSL